MGVIQVMLMTKSDPVVEIIQLMLMTKSDPVMGIVQLILMTKSDHLVITCDKVRSISGNHSVNGIRLWESFRLCS